MVTTTAGEDRFRDTIIYIATFQHCIYQLVNDLK
jgi:hypothetical protein